MARGAGAGADVAEVPILAGIMPITSVKGIQRMAQLSSAVIPAPMRDRVEAVAEDSAAVREVGVEIATGLAERLLAEGTPGLHFYTLNRSRSTLDVLRRLGPLPARGALVPTGRSLPLSAPPVLANERPGSRRAAGKCGDQPVDAPRVRRRG